MTRTKQPPLVSFRGQGRKQTVHPSDLRAFCEPWVIVIAALMLGGVALCVWGMA